MDDTNENVVAIEDIPLDEDKELVESVIFTEENRPDANSISATSLSESIDLLFHRIRHSIPDNPNQWKVRVNASEVDLRIDGYLQPLQLFDPSRLRRWNNLGCTKLTSKKSKNTFDKIRPLKGFKDPLKFTKKWIPKIRSNHPSASSFVLFRQSWQYVPPPDLGPPPHVLQRSSSDSVVKLSPFRSVPEKFHQYETPKVSNYRESKRRCQTVTVIPAAMAEIPEECIEEMYHAPVGSKDNYCYKKSIELIDADRALDEVSTVLNNQVLRMPTGKMEIVATLVAENCSDPCIHLLTHFDPIKVIPKKSMEEEIDTVTNIIPSEDLHLSEMNSDNVVGSAGIDNVDGNLQVHEETMPGLTNADIQPLAPPVKEKEILSFTIDLIEMCFKTPYFVRRTARKSTSLAKWVDSNILGEFFQTESKESIVSGKASRQKLKTQTSYKPPSNLPFKLVYLGQELRPKPRTLVLDFHETYKNHLVSNVQDRDDYALPTAADSIDDFLKEQEENPTVFRVFKSLCTKTFANYGIEDISSTLQQSCSSTTHATSIDEVETDDDTISNDDQDDYRQSGPNENEYRDNWWHPNGKYAIVTTDLQDESYFGSTEDEKEDIRSTSGSEQNAWALHPRYNKVYGIEKETIKEECRTNREAIFPIDQDEMDRLSEKVHFDDDEPRPSLSSILSSSEMSLQESHESTSTLKVKNETCSASMANKQDPRAYESGSVSTSSNRSKSMVFLKTKTSLKSSRTTMHLASFPSQTVTFTESENEARNAEMKWSNSKSSTKEDSRKPKILRQCLSKVSSFCALLFRPKSKG